ncbi:DUF11 domain-containing protein [Desulfatibacillum aliphaticivorans]|uniref:DUF11 domain-containing protein n=1 Tax=Desulfatibacillum aliphaticivorans TaxID=218208 RepID=UPI0004092CFC|nr:DUF11 domain-containing protein [Desulfatibacillum aliphaticivorans]
MKQKITQQRRIQRAWLHASALVFLVVMGLGLALAAMPDAGTKIVNQGSVFYTDENGEDRQASTNLVTLTIRQVYAASLEGDRSAYASPDGEALMFHTLTNEGNGQDVYCVSVAEAAGDSGDFERLQVVLDENQNGAVDDDEEVLHISGQAGYGTVTLDRGSAASLILVGKVPFGAVDAQNYGAVLTVQAQEGTGACQNGGVTDGGANADASGDTNQDTVIITNDGVLSITKTSVYQENGAGTADDTILYTVQIENQGANDAKDIAVTDDLPTGTAYQDASLAVNGDWTTNAGDDGNDGLDGQEPTHDAAVPGTISGLIDLLPAGDSVSFSYVTDLDDDLEGGALIKNFATCQGDLDNDPLTTEPEVKSNTTEDVFPAVYGVEIADTGAGALAGVNDGGDDDAANDSQLVDQADQGESVIFTNIVTNQGNLEDSFNLAVTATGFPAGTVFVFYNASGEVRLLDTNGDGTIDTGPVASGASVNVIVKAVLPSSASLGGPYTATVTATSALDPSGLPAADTVTETLTTIVSNIVDIANSNPAPGFNDGGVANADTPPAVVNSLSAVPGQTVIFTLYAANEGSFQDDYELSAWADVTGSVALPDDIQVEFTLPAGETVTHTGPLDSGEVFSYYAKVTSSQDRVTGAVTIFFMVKSPVTLAQDVKADQLVVATDESIALSPNQRAPIYPGSVVHYVHLLQNTGNTQEDVTVYVESQSHLRNELEYPTAALGSEVTAWTKTENLNIGDNVVIYDSSAASWISVALVDDGSGGLAIPMDPGDHTNIRVRVQATLNEVEFTRDLLVLRADVAVGSATASVLDITTVNGTQLTITKTGAVDNNCDGTPDTVFGTGTLEALPGECVIWKLEVINLGQEPICQVEVHDGAVAFTTLDGAPAIISEPAPGGTGSCVVNGQDFDCTVGNPYDIDNNGGSESFCLQPGEQAEIRFRVKVE